MKKQINHSRIILTVIPVAVILTAGIAFLFSRSSGESQVCQQNVARLKELENTDISSVEQAIQDIQGQLDAETDAQTREDIVNSSGILTNVQIRQAFAGSVIVGDSITQAISEYGYLDTDVVVSKRGLSVVNAQEQFSTAISLNPSHVFLAFGTNDLEIYNGDPTGFIDAYREKVQMVKDALPDVPIYINIILPIQDFAIDSNPVLGYYSQFNQALSDFCNEMGCTFIDNTFLVEDSSMYEPDGEHVIMDYYPKWLTYMAETAGLI